MFNIYDDSAKEIVATGFSTYESAEKEVYKMLANEVRGLLEDEEDDEKIKSLQSDLEDFKVAVMDLAPAVIQIIAFMR